MQPSDLENIRAVPAYILPEISGALERAGRAGAKPPVYYAGAGMYGIVFCDHWGRAWKVGRLRDPRDGPERQFMEDTLSSEFEWLVAAQGSEIRAYAAEPYVFHAPELVLERECVDGHPGSWADGSRLHELHRRIERAMLPRGWNAPEFKEDSYIIREDGTPVLVDISMVMRVGRNLVGFVEDVLASRRKTHDRYHDLAYFLLQEIRNKTVPPEVGRELLERLAQLDPEIRRSFVLP